MHNLINAAMGREKVDLLFKNGSIFNVFTGTFFVDHLAIKDGKIVGWGDYQAKEEVDCTGLYITPAFCDAHLHLESSLLTPSNLIQELIPLGTLSLICDPHEIANVAGLDGIQYVLEDTEGFPMNTWIMLPSCVPASLQSQSGAVLKADDLRKFFKSEKVLGLAEFMNYPGVLNCEADVIDKLLLFKGKNIDGHAPNVQGKELNAYICSGIKTDHECIEKREAIEKIAKGMYVQIREGTFAKNLETLLPIIDNYTFRRVLFCTDDRKILHIKQSGHINELVKRAVENGLEVEKALIIASYNPMQCYNLKERGAIAPNYWADILIFEDLVHFQPKQVYKEGVLVAEDGFLLTKMNKNKIYFCSKKITDSINISKIDKKMLNVKAGKSDYARIIELLPFQATTRQSVAKLKKQEGNLQVDLEQDIVKIAVFERYSGKSEACAGFIRGFGLKKGAIAQSISHDDHNILVLGVNDDDMLMAVKKVVAMKGGIALMADGKEIISLPLPIGGLMTNEKTATVIEICQKIADEAHKLGIKEGFDTIISLGYMSLTVIPELKITAKGLFDVACFDYSPVGI